MAIHSFNINEVATPKSSNSSNEKGVKTPGQLIKTEVSDDTIAKSKIGKLKKTNDSKSPYLSSDRVQLLSRVTERRYIHKKTPDFVSSFPLAVKLYKANSDEFKNLTQTSNKKIRKSVLTLPNESAPMPQVCTVSDMNDSEYYNHDDENRKIKTKKRFPVQNRKTRLGKDYEFYDRDARHCSQMNIDIDSSSTDLIGPFEGDGKRVSRNAAQNASNKEDFSSHDVWAVLRNINRFQFRPSPRISEESVVSSRKKKGFCRKRNNRKNRRIIETCRTEEIAYLAKFQVESKTAACASQSTSYDRITVIDKNDAIINMHEQISNTLTKSPNLLKYVNKPWNSVQKDAQNKTPPKDFFRPRGHAANKDNNNMVPIGKNRIDQCKVMSKVNRDKQKSSNSTFYKDSFDSSNYQANIREREDTNNSLLRIPSDYIRVNKFGPKTFRRENFRSPRHPDNTDYQKMSGVTTVLWNNEKEANVFRLDLMRKPRLVTTMPSAAIMPKPTSADIKRRLANMKFPLVILGKDQVSSSIEVADYDPPQFNGLDKHIWQFMVDWDKSSSNKEKNKQIPQNRRFWSVDRTIRNPKITRDEIILKARDKKDTNDCITNKKKFEYKRATPAIESNIILPPPGKKQKPIRNLKDKMLKLLYRKQSDPEIIKTQTQSVIRNEIKIDESTAENVAPLKTGVEFKERQVTLPKDLLRQSYIIPEIPFITDRSYNEPSTAIANSARYPWARAKWASDFIDNIIKKMKSGAYYSHEDKCYNQSDIKNGFVDDVLNPINYSSPHDAVIRYEFKESSIQTATTLDAIPFNKDAKCADLRLQDSDPFKTIPGFDDTLPALEIETLNFNQIVVKHCLTNIMVQFDVTREPDSVMLNVKKSTSCIPLSETESPSKIFKYRTKIFNAILPAELCCVLPNIMCNFINFNQNHAASPVIAEMNRHLSPIAEFTPDTVCSDNQFVMMPAFISPEVKRFLDGKFAHAKYLHLSKQELIDKTIKTINFSYNFITTLTSKKFIPLLMDVMNPIMLKMAKAKRPTSPIINPTLHQVHSTCALPGCTALIPYTGCNEISFANFNFTNIMKEMTMVYNFNISFITPSYNNAFCSLNKRNLVTINMALKNKNDLVNTITVAVEANKFTVDLLFEGFANKTGFNERSPNLNSDDVKSLPCRAIEYLEPSSTLVKNHSSKHVRSGKKIKRKGFMKLYKKCKSTSNISGERTSTVLSKISNLDEFFQALGSGKIMSSVFDGTAGHKLLSSVEVMKKWITDITPRQAMLVLLLTNKKDTPNLLRFRPVLLQGIAVNRITRAAELDMEIEVIERETMNNLPQFEGISYLPPNVENQDSLLEELYWIAKTTASDYQKPFDETSENLLKSLLEKRKKLNPSYLRVMARYVGLGLLKPPHKK